MMTYSRPQTLVVDADSEALDGIPKFGEAHFRQKNDLVITCKGFSDRLILHVDSRLILGRKGEGDDTNCPDVDLNVFNAYAYGVSKQHAVIEFADRVLILRDLGSRNGTYINRQQVAPNAHRVLRDNDVIHLGNLELHVHFQATSKP